jgi:hypothetical protein
MIVRKKARELQVGDKILGGGTNFFKVLAKANSALTGSTYPVITVEDSFGNRKNIETGANERLQDHIYEVEPAG